MEEHRDDIHTDSFLESINDIKDKYFDGKELSAEEAQAMKNYDKYRLEYLNASEDEADFDQRYFQLSVLANLHPYTEFLDSEDFTS